MPPTMVLKWHTSICLRSSLLSSVWKVFLLDLGLLAVYQTPRPALFTHIPSSNTPGVWVKGNISNMLGVGCLSGPGLREAALGCRYNCPLQVLAPLAMPTAVLFLEHSPLISRLLYFLVRHRGKCEVCR